MNKRSRSGEVSEKLRTYPSPKSSFLIPKWEVSVNVSLGEG